MTEVVVVGAGISGVGVGIALRARGITDFVLLERASSLGGTWRDNTYPGVAVDIPSSSYCFSFETGFPWSRAYAEGQELLAYVRHCAEKYGIASHVRYGATVVRATWHGDHWVTELATGERLSSRFLVAATGLFTTPVVPDFPGLNDFSGVAFHTARWRHDHDLTGRRVAVIGTGASAVQLVPHVAERAVHLTVFQRTPVWVAPRLDHRLSGPSRALRRLAPVRRVQRAVSEAGIELLTFAIAVYRRAPWLVGAVAAPVRWWMRRQAPDPRLIPSYTLGCKRPAPSNTYLPTFRRDHVRLVTSPIARIVSEGVLTDDGELHAVDTLVLATGFLTTERGNAPAFEVVGPEGELGAFWDAHRLQAYEGVAVPGFPNLFLTAGPYSGGFNWFSALEAHLDVIVGCLVRARDEAATVVEVHRAAHDAWMAELWRHAEDTVFLSPGCAGSNSYYVDHHGDAALPLPRWPAWRARRLRRAGTSGFAFRS